MQCAVVPTFVGCAVGDNLKSACAALISASVIIFAYAKVSNTEVTSVLAQLFHVVVEPLRWLL